MPVADWCEYSIWLSDFIYKSIALFIYKMQSECMSSNMEQSRFDKASCRFLSCSSKEKVSSLQKACIFDSIDLVLCFLMNKIQWQ